MPLQRDDVTRAALRLLDTIGLDALTVRRLAQELGVRNPALYWHFKNKQDLLDQMAGAILADALSGVRSGGADALWADWLAGVARAFRAALLSHRDGARVIAGANLSGSVIPGVFDIALGALRAAGFSPSASLNGVLTVFAYSFGAAFDAQTDPFNPQPNAHAGGFVALRAYLDADRYPELAATLEAVARAEPDRDRETEFEHGLQLILMGMEAALSAM
jgi:TetR/AcrR family transcriptional regulator, tetracycline repressor protein